MRLVFYSAIFFIVLLSFGNILWVCVSELHKLRHRRFLRYVASTAGLLVLFVVLRMLNGIMDKLS